MRGAVCGRHGLRRLYGRPGAGRAPTEEVRPPPGPRGVLLSPPGDRRPCVLCDRLAEFGGLAASLGREGAAHF